MALRDFFVLMLTVGWIVGSAGVCAQDTAAGEQTVVSPAFDILEYRVEGNTVLPVLAIEKAVYPHLGPGRSIEDVEKARAALERAYQSGGYLTVFVDIPEQKVEGGVVRLRVTEGKVERLRVSGNRYYSRGFIRAGDPSLEAGAVPYFPQVQKELAQLQSPTRKITPVLKPGREPGRVEVELQVEDKPPVRAEVELNNRQSPNTEPLRLQASGGFDNLWQRDHSVSVFAQTAPQETESLLVVSGTYLMPLGEKDRLAFFAVKSDSDVAAIGDVSVLGAGTILGARLVRPLRPRERYFHSLTLGVDYKDFDETTRLQGADNFETPISYTPMLVQYGGSYFGDKGATEGSVGLNFLVRSELLGNTDEEFENKRFKAKASYAFLRADLQRDQRLPRGLVLSAKLGVQYAGQPLISNEQFAAGGLETVRGYLEAEQTGDNGLLARLELRSPNLSRWLGGRVNELTLVGFLEGAHLTIEDPLPGQIDTFTLAGTGMGLRLRAFSHLDGWLDVGIPLEDATFTERYDPRVHFRLAYQFF
jgi:hemolysin activation/secretion protein